MSNIVSIQLSSNFDSVAPVKASKLKMPELRPKFAKYLARKTKLGILDLLYLFSLE